MLLPLALGEGWARPRTPEPNKVGEHPWIGVPCAERTRVVA